MFVTVSLLRYVCYGFCVMVCSLQIHCEGIFATDSLSRYVCYGFSIEVCLLQILC